MFYRIITLPVDTNRDSYLITFPNMLTAFDTTIANNEE